MGFGPITSWQIEGEKVEAAILDLRLGPQGPALVASGKACSHASNSGASWAFSPVDAGA